MKTKVVGFKDYKQTLPQTCYLNFYLGFPTSVVSSSLSSELSTQQCLHCLVRQGYLFFYFPPFYPSKVNHKSNRTPNFLFLFSVLYFYPFLDIFLLLFSTKQGYKGNLSNKIRLSFDYRLLKEKKNTKQILAQNSLLLKFFWVSPFSV